MTFEEFVLTAWHMQRLDLLPKPIFSMTDQQLPPCDTEMMPTEIADVMRAASGDGGEGDVVTGGEPSSDAQTDYDHIWRCIEQAARGA